MLLVFWYISFQEALSSKARPSKIQNPIYRHDQALKTTGDSTGSLHLNRQKLPRAQMSNTFTIVAVTSVAILAAIVLTSLWNKEDIQRLQGLKNKRRFRGARLSTDEQLELEKLQKKYWWY